MISEDDSLPSMSEAYRTGLDVFYEQFNDIAFYIEDSGCENFYHCILKKLFPRLRIEKIFPLTGKASVINAAKQNETVKTKVYIVDLDFDDLLGTVVTLGNVFYLERYSIENFLSEKDAIVKYVISEKPRLKAHDVEDGVNLEELVVEFGALTKKLLSLYLIAQKYHLGIPNISLGYKRFIDFGRRVVNDNELDAYQEEVRVALLRHDARMRIHSQVEKASNQLSMNNAESILCRIPGKFLLEVVKEHIHNVFRLPGRTLDSFSYRIADNCEFETLRNLRDNIHGYIDIN